jgi:hypothetical protein
MKKKLSKSRIKTLKMMPMVDTLVMQYGNLTEKELTKFYGWKIHKLVNLINICTPDCTDITKDDINANATISAIAELNKMQGHYAAEKSINTNLNIDADFQKVRELVEKNKKEF